MARSIIRRASLISTLITCSAMAAVIFSCKPGAESESETQTLDQFSKRLDADGNAIDQFELNHCGPDEPNAYVKTLIEADDKKPAEERAVQAEGYLDVVWQTASAAPQTLLEGFFDVLGGQIIVKPNATAECPSDDPFFAEAGADDDAAEGEDGPSDLDSCFAKSADGSAMRIYINEAATPDDTKASIRHNLLKALAYVYATNLAQGLLTEPADLTEFEGLMRSLGDKYLGAMKTQAVRDSSYGEVVDRMSELATADALGFGRMVFAHTMDSVYCNESTFDDLIVTETDDGKEEDSMFLPVFDEFSKEGGLAAAFESPPYATVDDADDEEQDPAATAP